MNVIEVTDLGSRYGSQKAVDGVSFSVEEGEIFGILGPNGAGKTTTVEMIAGLRTPDAGSIRVLGLDPRHDRAQLRSLVGVQLQESELPDRLTVGEALELFASFYEDPADQADLLDHLGLDGEARHRLPQPVGRPEAAVSPSPWRSSASPRSPSSTSCRPASTRRPGARRGSSSSRSATAA